MLKCSRAEEYSSFAGDMNANLNEVKRSTARTPARSLIPLRAYQRGVFTDRTTGILILHWSRQIGKSYTLAAWAVDRLLGQLLDHESWLVTVLSNSRENGAEFILKCANFCERLGATCVSRDESPDLNYKNMRLECHITIKAPTLNTQPSTLNLSERTGRIKVLAANPRTARGFSGDLILDEFAFHEDSAAIWEAAEPILSANREFLCRIASTGNGRHNMFYRLAAGLSPLYPLKSPSRSERDEISNLQSTPHPSHPFPPTHGTHVHSFTHNCLSQSGFPVSRITRTAAHALGVPVFHPKTRQPIAPAAARILALDKRAYDQNYECAFNDEAMALLTHELISAAERSPIAIDEQSWSAASLDRMARATSDLFIGNDIGRHRDLSVVTVLEKSGPLRRVIGMLRMNGLRLPAQKIELEKVCRLPNFRVFAGDMTGLGLGLVEFLQEDFGSCRIHGVHFSSTEPVTGRLRYDGSPGGTARVTEIMATDLLECFEDRSLEIPADPHLREDLAKPGKITSPGGHVSIAATRDETGHADHFWSLALAVRAARTQAPVLRFIPPSGRRAAILAARRDRSVIG